MTSAAEHYEQLLASVYVWMSGGFERALAIGAEDVATLAPGNGLAIDLGAGFGAHAIPLARAGYRVVAIDSSAELLEVLTTHAVDLQVRSIEADLLDFRRHALEPASLIVCLGDTLTHLRSTDDVERLTRDVAASLSPDGRFVATFRDYSHPRQGDARFIPVRSDANRIHTCFLEEQPNHMRVHDIVHDREGEVWRMRVGSYLKLRLAPERFAEMLRLAGLETIVAAGPRGMVRVDAVKKTRSMPVT